MFKPKDRGCERDEMIVILVTLKFYDMVVKRLLRNMGYSTIEIILKRYLK